MELGFTYTIHYFTIFRIAYDFSTDCIYVAIIVAYIAATVIDMMSWALKKLRRQKRIEIQSIDATTAETGGHNGFACMPVRIFEKIHPGNTDSSILFRASFLTEE